ncbi:MAG: hypothetical protein OXI83_08515 [Gemmatimonadota bacterium]|nr:hypothetical protein [Gemmatimonadota bacterium]
MRRVHLDAGRCVMCESTKAWDTLTLENPHIRDRQGRLHVVERIEWSVCSLECRDEALRGLSYLRPGS